MVDTQYYRIRKEEQGFHCLYQAHNTTGLPVVFIHGYSSQALMWEPMFRHLHNRSMWAFDLPGHGACLQPVVDGSVAEMVNALATWLPVAIKSKVYPPRYHLVGSSWGGAIVADFARAYPAKVASLTLVGPVGLCSRVDPWFVQATLGKPARAQVRECMRRVYVDQSQVTDVRVEDSFAYLNKAKTQQYLAKICPLLLQHPLSTLPTVLAKRTWLVWGEQDEVISCPTLAQAQQLAGQVSIYPKVGHLPHLERTADFCWRWRQFVKEFDNTDL